MWADHSTATQGNPYMSSSFLLDLYRIVLHGTGTSVWVCPKKTKHLTPQNPMFYHSNCCRIRYIMVPPLDGAHNLPLWPGLVGRVQHRPDWLVLRMRHQPRGCRDSSGLLGSLVGPGKSTNHWHVRHLTRDKQGNKQMQWQRTPNLATKIMLPSSGSSTYLWFHLLQAHLSQCCNVLPPGICPPEANAGILNFVVTEKLQPTSTIRWDSTALTSLHHLPSGYVKIAIENGPVEIVDFPIKHGDFP